MYKVTANKKYDFKIALSKEGIELNGKAINLDRVELNSNTYHILYHNKSFNVVIVNIDKELKTADLLVNGNPYHLDIKDQFDELLGSLGMDNLTSSKVLHIKSPMPGLVLSVLIKEGDAVKKGDNLIVLEAMKMENIIKSSADGIVKRIGVKTGDKVEKNEVLVFFE